MNTNHPADHHDSFEASGRSSAKETAREQFIHGVLGFLHHDKPLRQEQRVQAVMRSLAAAGTASHARRWTFHPLRAFTGIAAAAALAASAFLLWPTTTTATSMIESSLDAARAAGDRRYEMSIFGPGGRQPENAPKGTIDVRSSDRYVVRFQTPRGELAFGRDDTGEWTIRPDGTTDRLNAQRGRPRWLDSGESSVLLGSVESVLETLKTEYATNRVEAAPLPGMAELCNRLTATRKSIGGPEPLRIELWFDKDTKLVRRMEMHWPEMKGPGPGGPPGGPPVPGSPRPDGVEPRGPDRPSPGMGGPRPPGGRQGGPPGGPPVPGGPPPGMGGPPPCFMDGPPDFRGGGPGGPGGMGGPGGGGGRPGPGGWGGGGGGGGPRQPPPPSLVVIEMVDAQPFAENWFTPEAHARK